MATHDDDPYLVRIGADTRESASTKNLDVSGTVGPDYLGQQTVDVDGHSQDRPGVKSRLPESSRGDDPRVHMMDTGEELPVLLSSNMRADPIEGTQGSYTQIVDGECARCGYDRLVVSTATLPGETQETCNACGAIQDGRAEEGYRMPKTQKERATQRKNAGPRLGEVHGRAVVDLEPDTGYGPMVALVKARSTTSLWKDDVEDLYWMLVENDDINLPDSLDGNLRGPERVVAAMHLLPDHLTVTTADDDESADSDDSDSV